MSTCTTCGNEACQPGICIECVEVESRGWDDVHPDLILED